MPLDVVVVADQQSARGPPQPSYILRGHTAQIHSVQLLRRNTCLLTGDADGWLVYWKLDTRRPLAVWRAHDAAILGTAEWGPAKIITHGRDNTLRIWQLKGADASYSTVLPAEGSDTHRPKPWLLHTLPVNTLNFCAFSMCYQRGRATSSDDASDEPIYVAVPGRDDKMAEVYEFPDEKLACIVPRIDITDTGMVMAVKLVHHQPSHHVLVIVGYEGGLTAVHRMPRSRTGATGELVMSLAQTIYLSQPHTQPILSVDALPDGSTYFSSSADAIVAAHRIPELPDRDDDVQSTSSVANQEQEIATDGEEHTDLDSADISADAAEADGMPSGSPVSVDSEARTPENLSFPKLRQRPNASPTENPLTQTSVLSTLLASAPPQPNLRPRARPAPAVTIQPAHKMINTKHAGQQSLHVRSDGRILATGGWDSSVRIYSTKTLKELAVLKWHKVGIYAVDFGSVLGQEDVEKQREEVNAPKPGAEVVKRETGLAKLQRQREEAVQAKHWVAAGAKDGKVSLWEVF